MAHYDDLKTGAIAYAAFVSTVILLVIILLVRALCYSWVEAEDAKKLTKSSYVAADMEIARQKTQIANYAKIQVPAVSSQAVAADAAPEMEDQLHIPVSRARELLLKEWNSSETGDGK